MNLWSNPYHCMDKIIVRNNISSKNPKREVYGSQSEKRVKGVKRAQISNYQEARTTDLSNIDDLTFSLELPFAN